MHDSLLVKPFDKNEDDLVKILAKRFNMNKQLIEEMRSYFKKDFYLILSMFAGQNIVFPPVKELNELRIKLDIYKEFNAMKPENANLTDILNPIAEKYNCSSNQVYTIRNEIKDLLEN